MKILTMLALGVGFYLPFQAQSHLMHTTNAVVPSATTSNEANSDQLAHARAEGDSVNQCINWILNQTKGSSGQIRAGEYKLTYALSVPEGWYEYSNNAANWREPTDASAHLWLFVQDGADERIVPPLDIQYAVMDANGNQLLSNSLSYAWMPLINGYGDNINLTQNGNYTLLIKIAPPEYRRHDPYNGDRFYEYTQAAIPIHIPNHFSAQQRLSEAMEAQTQLAKAAGNAYGNTLQAMYKQANDGRDTTMGDYFIAYAIEYAEGYWFYDDGNFRYKSEIESSARKNAHVEVSERDKKTGRFMHNLHVTATLYDKNGNKIDTKGEMFMWHPWLYHYGENWRVASTGNNYRLHIHIDPPAYRRYGKTQGNQFITPVDLDFNNVKIMTGER